MNEKRCKQCGEKICSRHDKCLKCDKRKHEAAKQRVLARAKQQANQQAEWDRVPPMPLEELIARYKSEFTNNKSPNGWAITHEQFLQKHHAPPPEETCNTYGVSEVGSEGQEKEEKSK